MRLTHSVHAFTCFVGLFLLTSHCLHSQDTKSLFESYSVRASRDTLYFGEILRLDFPGPHGKEMVVKTEDNRVYFIAGLKDEYFQPLFSREYFAKAKSIDLDLSNLKSFDYGLKTLVAVFDKTGAYEFRMADNVETDVRQKSAVVRIYYYNVKRPQ